MKNKIINRFLTLSLILALCLSLFPAASDSKTGVTESGFSVSYANQLTDTAREIYDGLYGSREKMKTGNAEIIIEITPESNREYVSGAAAV